MAINTLEKRAASLAFGCAGRAGVRPPTGTTSRFLRGATLGLYTVDQPAIIISNATCGWRFGYSDLVFVFEDGCR